MQYKVESTVEESVEKRPQAHLSSVGQKLAERPRSLSRTQSIDVVSEVNAQHEKHGGIRPYIPVLPPSPEPTTQVRLRDYGPYHRPSPTKNFLSPLLTCSSYFTTSSLAKNLKKQTQNHPFSCNLSQNLYSKSL